MIKKNIILSIGLLAISSTNLWAKSPYPQDVQKLTHKMDNCIHFAGEFSGDPALDQSRKLNQKIAFYCNNTRKELKQAKIKYKKYPHIIQMLAEYDDILPD